MYVPQSLFFFNLFDILLTKFFFSIKIHIFLYLLLLSFLLIYYTYVLFACQVKNNFNVQNDPAFSEQTTKLFDFDSFEKATRVNMFLEDTIKLFSPSLFRNPIVTFKVNSL